MADWVLLGPNCVNGQALSFLPTQVTADRDQSCQAACDAHGFSYSVQDQSGVCACGYGFPSSKLASDTPAVAQQCPLGQILMYRRPSVMPQGWNSLGCAVDNDTRIVTGFLNGDGSFKYDVSQCIRQCVGIGYKIAGTQYHDQCFCGNELNFPAQPASDCNMPCDKTPQQQCGGIYRMNFFSAQVATLQDLPVKGVPPPSTVLSTSSAPATSSSVAPLPPLNSAASDPFSVTSSSNPPSGNSSFITASANTRPYTLIVSTKTSGSRIASPTISDSGTNAAASSSGGTMSRTAVAVIIVATILAVLAIAGMVAFFIVRDRIRRKRKKVINPRYPNQYGDRDFGGSNNLGGGGDKLTFSVPFSQIQDERAGQSSHAPRIPLNQLGHNRDSQFANGPESTYQGSDVEDDDESTSSDSTGLRNVRHESRVQVNSEKSRIQKNSEKSRMQMSSEKKSARDHLPSYGLAIGESGDTFAARQARRQEKYSKSPATFMKM